MDYTFLSIRRLGSPMDRTSRLILGIVCLGFGFTIGALVLLSIL